MGVVIVFVNGVGINGVVVIVVVVVSLSFPLSVRVCACVYRVDGVLVIEKALRLHST